MCIRDSTDTIESVSIIFIRTSIYSDCVSFSYRPVQNTLISVWIAQIYHSSTTVYGVSTHFNVLIPTGFFINISATAEASDFKFGTQLGFATAHHKITPRVKSGRGHKLGELPNIWGSPLIFLQLLKVATSKLAGWWGLVGIIMLRYVTPLRQSGRTNRLAYVTVTLF